MQQAMYLPCLDKANIQEQIRKSKSKGHKNENLGSHFTMELAGSKQALVISATLKDSW